MKENFVFGKKLKRISLLMAGIGIVLFIIGALLEKGEPKAGQRIWANVLMNGAFFTALSVASLFFIAAHTIGYGGWHIMVKRVMEAIAQFIPYAGVLMLLVVIGLLTHSHHLYHWNDKFIYEKEVTIQELRDYEKTLVEHNLVFKVESENGHHTESEVDHHEAKAEPASETAKPELYAQVNDEDLQIIEGAIDVDPIVDPEMVEGDSANHQGDNHSHGHSHHQGAGHHHPGNGGLGNPEDHSHGHHGGFLHKAETMPHLYGGKEPYATMDPATTVANPHFDRIINSKSWFLNLPFWLGRFAAYFLLWIGLLFVLRRLSIFEDSVGGLKSYKKAKVFSAIFLVVFAISSSASSWDWIMSIDTHWFSTMFGWYNFASACCAALAVMILITVFLKESGQFRLTTTEHVHDLGKLMFGFSVFWTYLWFSQYMLYWYANIPEETLYFQQRMQIYGKGYFLLIAINFLFPFLVLMTRAAKRNFTVIKIAAIVVFLGHALDYYLMIMPGTLVTTTKAGNVVHNGSGFGLIEIGMFAAVLGIFIFVVMRALSKANLYPLNHPFAGESLEHHT